MSHLLQSQTENSLSLSAQVICVVSVPPAKMSFLLFFHSYAQGMLKFSLMARSALMPDVKGCKSMVVSVPWTVYMVQCSHFPAQSSGSSDAWSFWLLLLYSPGS